MKKAFSSIVILAAPILAAVLLLSSCGLRKPHFLELGAGYSYDALTGVYVRYPSDLSYGPNELFELNGRKPKYLTYDTVTVDLPVRLGNAGSYSYRIEKTEIAYAVVDGTPVLARAVDYQPRFSYAAMKGEPKTVMIWSNDRNAYFVNLADGTAHKVFEDGRIAEYEALEQYARYPLIWARIVEADFGAGYIAFISNRNNMATAPQKNELFVLDLNTGEEKLVFPLERREFIALDTSGGNARVICLEEEASVNYAVNDGDPMPVVSRLYAYSLDGGKPELLLELTLGQTAGSACAPGYFYYTSGRSVFLFDYRTKGVTEIKLTEAFVEIKGLKLSGDGKYMAYLRVYSDPNDIIETNVGITAVGSGKSSYPYTYGEDGYAFDFMEWGADSVLVVNFADPGAANKYISRFVLADF